MSIWPVSSLGAFLMNSSQLSLEEEEDYSEVYCGSCPAC